MRETEYHIRKIKADLKPHIGETLWAGTHLELEIENGDFDPEENVLRTEANLELNLYSTEDHEEAEDGEMGEPSYGSIEVEMTIYIEEVIDVLPDEIDLEVEMLKWEDEGYEHVDRGLMVVLETGILSEVIAPIDQLLDDSFSGILPLYVFTQHAEDEEDPPDDTDSE